MLLSGLYWSAGTPGAGADAGGRVRSGAERSGISAGGEGDRNAGSQCAGDVGAYQAATIYALMPMPVEHPNAQIFAEIASWFLTLPVAVGGAVAVAFAGFDITDLHRHVKEANMMRRPGIAPEAQPGD